MKYKITIKQISEKKTLEREWEKLYDNESFEKILEKNPDAKQYAYQEYEGVDNTERTIYEQTRDYEGNEVIDLKTVIDAFNS